MPRRRTLPPAHPRAHTRLYWIRRNRGLSQERLARLADVSTGTVRKLENGSFVDGVNLKYAIALATVFAMAIEDVFTEAFARWHRPAATPADSDLIPPIAEPIRSAPDSDPDPPNRNGNGGGSTAAASRAAGALLFLISSCLFV